MSNCLTTFWQFLGESFSAVSKPTNYSSQSSWRDLSDLHASFGRKAPRLKNEIMKFPLHLGDLKNSANFRHRFDYFYHFDKEHRQKLAFSFSFSLFSSFSCFTVFSFLLAHVLFRGDLCWTLTKINQLCRNFKFVFRDYPENGKILPNAENNQNMKKIAEQFDKSSIWLRIESDEVKQLGPNPS